MNIFKESAKLIGWLSGSIVGIGAILYACGYIVTQTHLNLIGLGSILVYEPNYYLIKGANFLVVTGSYIATIFLDYKIFILIFFVFYFLVKHEKVFYFLVKHEKFNNFKRFRNWLDRINERWPWLWKSLIFLLMLNLLFFHLILRLEDHRCTLNISGLLYSTIDDSTISNDKKTNNQKDPCTKIGLEIKKSIISTNYRVLGNTFYRIIMQILEAGALLFFARRITVSWRFHFLLLMPFMVIFIIYLTLLPMLFGVLMKQTEINPIKLVSSNKSISCQSDNLYLLHKTSQEFILWNSTEKKVYWLPKGEIQMAVIGPGGSLFEVIKNQNGGGK